MTATVVRPTPEAVDRALRVRTTPLGHGARSGWLLELGDTAWTDDGGGDVVDFFGVWTRDAAMKAVLRVVRKAAASDATVLVRGETGTGKELVVRALHALSRRADGPFQAINCAALSPSLLESELFGHVRGAFTGAVRDNPGHVRLAHRGTLLLDEVAELPLELQAKLLRVLETRLVTPVGSQESIPVDVRFVAATHRSLRESVEAGTFRADLMYRLRVVPLFLPPLRDRGDDVELVAHKLVERANARGGRQVERVGHDALAALAAYPWPGNVRELANAIEYAFVVGEGPVLSAADLPPEIAAPGQEGPPLVNAPPSAARSADPRAERILRAIERAGGHRGRAARLLGVSRITLWRRMKALGLDADAAP